MVTYGIKTKWKINYVDPKTSWKEYFTCEVLDEDKNSIKIYTDKGEERVISKNCIINANRVFGVKNE